MSVDLIPCGIYIILTQLVLTKHQYVFNNEL